MASMGLFSKNFPLLLFISTIASDTQVFADIRLKSSDFDDLRVSNNQLSGHLNYQSITPGDETPIIQSTNHIGKPLVPSLAEQQQSNSLRLMTHQQQKQAVSAGPRLQSHMLNLKKSLEPAKTADRLAQGETCMWMSLETFKRKSLKPTELIIRDDEDQLCYVLVLTAYLKSSEDNYFLLSNLKALPHANKVKFESRTSYGSTNEHHSPLNCSAMASVAGSKGATSLFLPNQRLPNRSFREEITIAADCGYLVLNTHVDGSFLTLEAISFYQNPDGSVQLPITELRKNIPVPVGPSLLDNMIFSTNGTGNSPLFTIPNFSHYICKNRIRLTGHNSVQLILDRFELLRMAPNPATKESTDSSHSLKSNGLMIDYDDEEQSNINEKFITLARRSPGSAQVQQHRPHIIALEDNHISVARCANPVNPLEPLTTMVGANFKKDNHALREKVIAEKMHVMNNSASKYHTAAACSTWLILCTVISACQFCSHIIQHGISDEIRSGPRTILNHYI